MYFSVFRLISFVTSSLLSLTLSTDLVRIDSVH